ncbi:MAG TPA: EamA family transporter [Candidatus Limnocylindria bacterium]|nr:EamA family transporter [Candidatus Limnocylindria bacterium]
MVYLAFALCCLIWGSTFLAIRIGNEAVAPVWAATLRLALATPALALLAWATRAHWPRGAALRGALLFGFFNYGVNLALLYWGEQTVPSGIAAVFYATVPLSTALLAPLFGIERLSPRKLAAATVAFVGVGVIFAGELSLDVPFAGLLAILGAASSAALSSVMLKRAPRQDTLPANAIAAAVGLPVCLIASVAIGESRALPVTAAGWVPILYLVVAGSLGAYLLFTWLIKSWSVTNASYIGVVVPVVAVILGAIVKQERPAALTFVGAAIVIAAVVYALRPPSPGALRSTAPAR